LVAMFPAAAVAVVLSLRATDRPEPVADRSAQPRASATHPQRPRGTPLRYLRGRRTVALVLTREGRGGALPRPVISVPG
jgi:hypothetical protein